jgi:hypothetical protein
MVILIAGERMDLWLQIPLTVLARLSLNLSLLFVVECPAFCVRHSADAAKAWARQATSVRFVAFIFFIMFRIWTLTVLSLIPRS